MASSSASKVTTLIFDVDDTLYDVGTGFTHNRLVDGAQLYMVEKLGFPDRESAQAVWTEYFAKYHSTAKALAVAEQEGKFPPAPAGDSGEPRFKAQDLSEYWATNLDFGLLGGPKKQFLEDLKASPLKQVAFSNGPRLYVKRVLVELGLWEMFGEDRLYAVDDVLPHCKPEKEAFDLVFKRLGVKAEECIMVEDSMKNIRAAKELGLKTILVAGKGKLQSGRQAAGKSKEGAMESEMVQFGDAPLESDPAVDVSLEVVEEMRSALPGLWASSPYF